MDTAASGPTVINIVIDAVGIPTLEHIITANEILARRECFASLYRRLDTVQHRYEENPHFGRQLSGALAKIKYRIEGIARSYFSTHGYSQEPMLPNLSALGLGNLLDPALNSVVRPASPPGLAAKVIQASHDPDSMIGHREHVGAITEEAYSLFYHGFPEEFVKELEARTGHRFIYNRMGGGIQVIKKNMAEHSSSPDHPLVLYASKCDPLLQIAGDVQYYDPAYLAKIADMAFELAMVMDIRITRTISRPYFIREDGEPQRVTEKRHDRTIDMGNRATLIDVLQQHGIYTVSVGKPADMIDIPAWSQRIKLGNRSEVSDGLRFITNKDSNPYTAQGIFNALRGADERGGNTFIYANFVDTDSLTGHTRDMPGSLSSIQETDRCIGLIMQRMKAGDIIIVTADHGMEDRGDYGYHTKEPMYVLVKRIGRGMDGIEIGNTGTFACVGYLVSQAFGLSDEYVNRCGLHDFFH